ncbi:hypothetical protein BaRGS_00031130 [Batillaria attramentaria]|uniref:Uncharacterized protein n=1 Tax=Batillaria attramentaria TaxID=370345 RepID=A0ABD0JRR5_9CAEN
MPAHNSFFPHDTIAALISPGLPPRKLSQWRGGNCFQLSVTSGFTFPLPPVIGAHAFYSQLPVPVCSPLTRPPPPSPHNDPFHVCPVKTETVAKLE